MSSTPYITEQSAITWEKALGAPRRRAPLAVPPGQALRHEAFKKAQKEKRKRLQRQHLCGCLLVLAGVGAWALEGSITALVFLAPLFSLMLGKEYVMTF